MMSGQAAPVCWLRLCVFVLLSGSSWCFRFSSRTTPRAGASLLRAELMTMTSGESQIIRLVEKASGRGVVLIGTMHYNPASISLSQEVVSRLASQNQLSAVLVESCEARWNRTLKSQPQGTLLRSLLDNEMQAASESALAFNVPTLLGDQSINQTNARMKETFRESLSDLTSLQFGRLLGDLDRARKVVLSPKMVDGSVRLLGPADLLSPSLVLGTPVSLVRYPLAIALKAPVFGALLVGSVAATLVGADSTPSVGAMMVSAGDWSLGDGAVWVERLVDVTQTLATVLLEVALVGRTFLVCLLEERNVVLADNIRRACSNAGAGQSVVAVLGAAHLNGIAALLSNGFADEVEGGDG